MNIKQIFHKKNRLAEGSAQPRDAQAETANRDIAGWVSPVYSESRDVRLDLNKALDNRCVCLFQDADAIDAYKLLKIQVQHFTQQKGLNTLMVTSVGPGEGKTLTAINLAAIFAKDFSRTVLLVDCDLKRQKIHQYLGYSSDKGLIDHIFNDTPIKDLIVWPGIEKLTIISGGKKGVDSAEILSSPKMETLVQEMKSRYPERYLIFDTPPVLTGADAVAFARLVDGIVVVVQAGKTSIQDIRKALTLIPREKFLGFVLNRIRHKVPTY